MKNQHRLTLFAVALALLIPSTAFAVLTTLAQSGPSGTIDLDSSGVDDIRGYTCNCPTATGIRAINGTLRAFSNMNWANTDLAVAQGRTYVTDPSNGGAIPSDGDVLLYQTPGNSFYKLRLQVGGTNTSAGIEIEYEFLGMGAVTPPVASFTSSSVDIYASFSDTSTESPSSWAWTFGDGGTSGSQNPSHNYPAAGTYNACLIASNAGGPSPQVCNNITVTADPSSVTIAPGSGIDFDNDMLDDLAVEMVVGCGAGRPNRLNPMNSSEWAELSKNYDLVVLADAQAASTSTSPFCSEEGNPNSPLVVLASSGNFYKVWTPTNDAGGIRFIFALLGTPPPVPTAGFTFTTLDLIASFTNTSTGTVTSNNWDFDDGSMSTSNSPSHAYVTAGTYNVCLIAGNAGGDSAPFCDNVTVSEVPSTTVPANMTIDFDMDGTQDLLVEPTGACGSIPNRFVVQNGTQWSSISQSFASVDLADAQGLAYGNSPFCHAIANPNDVFVVLTSSGNYVKVWVPQHNGSGARFQFEVLIDTTPDAFSFTDVTGAPLNTLTTSDTITVSGINAPVSVSVTGGLYSINGGGFTAAPGMVSSGQMVAVQNTSSTNFSTTTNTTLDINGVMDTFSVTTAAEDLIPNPFMFADQTDVDLNTLVTSAPVMITGLNSNPMISVTGGMYSINGGPFTSAPGTITDGQTVTLQQTSSANFSTTTDTVLTINGVTLRGTAVMDTFSVTTLAEDLVPDPFMFTDQVDVDLSTVVTSDSITVSNINSNALISISGGLYSIDGAPFTAAGGTVTDGQMVTVQQTSSANFSTTTDTVLDIGGVMDTFSITTLDEDLVPEPFMFTDQIDVELSTVITSNAIQVAGVNSNPMISISGGMYSIDGGPFTATPGTVTDGQMVTVQQTSSGNFSTTTDAILDIGGVMDTFSATTVAEDLVPEPFMFTDQIDVDLSTVITSDAIQVAGVNSNPVISITDGLYSIDGGPFTANAGTVTDGQMVTVQQTSSANFSTTTDTVLDIGGVMDTFSVTTLDEDLVPDPFMFTDQLDVDLSTLISSDAITVSDINSNAPISVTGGLYSINGGPFTGAPGTVTDGQMVVVQQTSSANFSTTTDTVLDISGVMDTFSITTLDEDLIPDPFVFPPVEGVMQGDMVMSSPITVSDINSPTMISIIGGEYSINGGPFTSTDGTVINGDIIVVKVQAADTAVTSVTATLTIGGVSGDFTVTTGVFIPLDVPTLSQWGLLLMALLLVLFGAIFTLRRAEQPD